MARSRRLCSSLGLVLVLAACLVTSAGIGACAEPNLTPYEDEVDAAATDDVAPVDAGTGTPRDASTADTASPVDAADAASGALRVFVTSSTQGGNLGGLAGADTICKTLAMGAGLPGDWAAWLSTKNGPHAIDRVTSAGPWSLVSGEVVAASKTVLASGTLAHAIDHDEKGILVATGSVWTGTGPSGQYLTNDCDFWVNGNDGRVGVLSATDGTWTSSGADGCGSQRRLYCFQK